METGCIARLAGTWGRAIGGLPFRRRAGAGSGSRSETEDGRRRTRDAEAVPRSPSRRLASAGSLHLGRGVEELSGLTCMATGSTSPFFNPADSSANLVDPQSALDGALDRHRSAELAWLLKLQPDLDREMVAHARRRGVDFEQQPVWRISMRAWADPAPRPTASLSIVAAGRDTIADAVWCFAEAFGRSRGRSARTGAEPADRAVVHGLHREPVGRTGGYVHVGDDSQCAAGGRLQRRDSTVASRPRVRHRPHQSRPPCGTGPGLRICCLGPSPMGEAMYRRMGFESFGTYLEAVM